MINVSAFKIEAKVIDIIDDNSNCVFPQKTLKLKATKVEAQEKSSYCDEIKAGDVFDFSISRDFKVKTGSILTMLVLFESVETHAREGPAFRDSKSFSEIKVKKY